MTTWHPNALGRFFAALERRFSKGFQQTTLRGEEHVLGNLFCNMGDTINRTDGKSTVQHASKKDEPVTRVSGHILPVFPDKIMGCVSHPISAGHDSADHDIDQKAEDEKRSQSANTGQCELAEHHSKTAYPSDDQITDEDVPTLRPEPRMEECVGVDNHTARHGAIACHGKCPCNTVHPAGESAADPAIFRTGGDGCPVIYCEQQR